MSKEKVLGAKENIEYIKEELSSDEKLLGQLIKTERFFKKYKKPLIAVAALVVLALAGYEAYDWKRTRDLAVANEAYMQLLKSPSKEAEELLASKDPKLYDLYLYQKAVRKKDETALAKLAASADPLISDMARYHLAALKSDLSKLHEVALSDNVLRDMALLDEALLLDKKGETKKARNRLARIGKESPAYEAAQLLKHYGTKVSR